MPYTNVQFIAFTIDTAPLENKDGSSTYLGLQDPQQDIQARCELMARAMQTALDNLPTSSPPEAPGTTLKVFLAPEFFFRGSTGAYEMDDVQYAIAQVQALAADAQWQDWVFGFGSILGHSSPHLDTPPYDIDPNADKEVYNFTLIQDGGPGSSGDQGARVVMKELMSGVDFIADKATGEGMLLANVDHMEPAGAGSARQEQQVVNYDGAGIFDLAGITWGVEICLDHSEDVSRLKQSPQVYPGSPEVQLQLVPSCGMDIQKDSVITMSGGYVFNCDGQSGGSSALAKVADVDPVDLDDINSSSSHPVDDADIVLGDVSPPQIVPIADLYQDGAGEVVIYPSQVLPAAATVEGSLLQLHWPASKDYRFDFDLIYDANGEYQTLLCAPVSGKTNFYGNKYFLPLDMVTWSKDAIARKSKTPDVEIAVKLVAGTGGYDYGVWCKIEVPDFNFEGVAFEFNDSATDPPPQTIW
ncbi:hypothetical protein G6O69_24395 [Pseudenhygromyxa sp. WMMC2535]|uniref:hypothetical protein n=1 Tax=Pseudenhygromyxa sp. WMMC2535 TaxID=2712867 RepID=UPI001555379E|nr:hypothetical protein [Pseudenhygromyxa sp. WMMC2535]NVB41003.1 hypothetical protein [Pseudenhygromyxa sp. WMMC2535]